MIMNMNNFGAVKIDYLSSPVSPYDVATVGIPKLFVKDLIASENTPVVVVSKTKSGGVWASIISPSFEHTKKLQENIRN